MITLGYALSSEENKPNHLIAHAQMAERSGFKFLLISDHFHPWVPQQGQLSILKNEPSKPVTRKDLGLFG